jgi:hypothetical protein
VIDFHHGASQNGNRGGEGHFTRKSHANITSFSDFFEIKNWFLVFGFYLLHYVEIEQRDSRAYSPLLLLRDDDERPLMVIGKSMVGCALAPLASARLCFCF